MKCHLNVGKLSGVSSEGVHNKIVDLGLSTESIWSELRTNGGSCGNLKRRGLLKWFHFIYTELILATFGS